MTKRMKVEWLNELSVAGLRTLLNDVHAKMHERCKELADALPEELRDKYGSWDSVSKLVYHGECTFTLASHVGEIGRSAIGKLKSKGREEVKPVAEAWRDMGVRLGKVSFSPFIDRGVIEAHFLMK